MQFIQVVEMATVNNFPLSDLDGTDVSDTA